jgi:hypothetical protein
VSWKTDIARRPLLASLAGLFGVAVAGGLVYEGVHVFGHRYPRTKYDDLLDQLSDRESAAKLGQVVIAENEKHVHPWPGTAPDEAATELRSGPGRGSLARAVDWDIDESHSHLAMVEGWLIPFSLVQAAILAATVQQPS